MWGLNVGVKWGITPDTNLWRNTWSNITDLGALDDLTFLNLRGQRLLRNAYNIIPRENKKIQEINTIRKNLIKYNKK